MDETNTQSQNVNTAEGPAVNSPTMSTQAPSEDLSRTTIAVLVLLTLMISILGTWTVLNEINAVKMSSLQQPKAAVGQVQMRIENPPGYVAPTDLSATTGRVSLIIK